MAGFARDVRNFRLRAEQRMRISMQELSLSVHARLIELTPVDTGFARRNWVIDLNEPRRGTVNEQDDPVPTVQAAEADDAIIISNGANYIFALERGHSAQAPHGMRAVAMAEFDGMVVEAVDEAKRRS